MNRKLVRRIYQAVIAVILLTLFPSQSTLAAIAKPGSVPVPPASTLNIANQFVRNPSFGNLDFMTGYPQAVVVTPSKSTQTGSIWSKNKIDLNQSFTYNTWHYLGDKQGSVADGMAFVLQNDSRGQSAYGSVGGGLGVYPYGWIYNNGIVKNYVHNALAIEMDDWWNNINGKADDGFDLDIPGNVVNPNLVGHIAVVQPRLVPSNDSKDLHHFQYQLGNTAYRLANNKWRKFMVSWVPTVTYVNGIRILGGDLSYTFGEQVDGNGAYPTQTFHIPNVLTYFNSDHVYFGYTGATGAYPTFQAVSVDKLPQTAAPITLNFVEKGTNTVLADPITMNGEPGTSWNGASRRQDWIQKMASGITMSANIIRRQRVNSRRLY